MPTRGRPRTRRYWRLAWGAQGRGGGIFSTTYVPSGPHTDRACCSARALSNSGKGSSSKGTSEWKNLPLGEDLGVGKPSPSCSRCRRRRCGRSRRQAGPAGLKIPSACRRAPSASSCHSASNPASLDVESRRDRDVEVHGDQSWPCARTRGTWLAELASPRERWPGRVTRRGFWDMPKTACPHLVSVA